jgi:Zn-dependent protease with chaperone function
MNFFEHQAQARSKSRWLVFLFLLAVVAIAVAVDVVLLVAFGLTGSESKPDGLFTAGHFAANAGMLAGGAVGTVSVIGIASLVRTAGLRAGGGKVARELGGTLVEADTRDRRRRRLRNIVEEIALASGVPVPEVYVLEQEAGINAFAAGFGADDAAVAVTRGALETLSRDELQGVIAHEFSHILNGDMRLNIRLMGALFGILMLALIGRRILIHSHFTRGSRDKNGAPIILIAIGVMAIGYIGMFFGRWIKSAVSRQREYLADASAVQFTRNPDGIGGALKKIAVHAHASWLDTDSEEIGHMLFGAGRKASLFATHPPIEERITRIQPGFRTEELQDLARRMERESRRRAQERAADRQGGTPKAGGGILDPASIIDQIGNPDWERILLAATLAASIPDNIRQAAHSTEWAPEVLFFTLLDAQDGVREEQLLIIAREMGSDSEAQVRALLSTGGLAAPEQRLPLMEMALPALKRRPPEFVERVLRTVSALIEVDGRIEVFEYLLAKVIAQHLWSAMNPGVDRSGGKARLAALRQQAIDVLAVLSWHGGDEARASVAFAAGLEGAGLESVPLSPVADWIRTLDQSLPALDRLRIEDKEALVRGLVAVVLHDGRLEAGELEMLRVVCDLIHVPMPMMG